jgi:hypothetical protein
MKTMNKVTLSLCVLALCAVLGACGGGGNTTTNTTGGTSSGGSATANANANGGHASGGGASSVGAIATPTIRADGTVVIGPGFAPTPIIMAGTAGGTGDASTLGGAAVTGYCVGVIPSMPQHVLEITAPISHLRIVVDAFTPGSGGSNDTTLFVRVPGGNIWCDDDGGGELQPMVEGAVGPGRVEIFVGAYSSSGVGARYKIAFTESSDYTHYSISGGSAPSYEGY